MSWIGLEEPVEGTEIDPEWGAKVVRAIDILHGQHAVDYSGYIHRDIIPDRDLFYRIGMPDARIREFHSGYAYVDYQLFVQGKPVLKDGDPINIYDIFDSAREKITQAIDYSKVSTVDEKLSDILQRLDVKISELKDSLVNIYQRLLSALDVDTLATEETKGDVVMNITADGYQDVIRPPTGKKISTRSWLLHTDATSGVIKLYFPQSGKIIGVLFASKQGFNLNNRCNVTGYENEPVRLEWSGLSQGSNIFWQLTFKEV